MAWQDVLDEIAAGRSENLTCPLCRKGKLVIETLGEPERSGGPTRISCPQCKKYIEGRFTG